MEIEGTAGGSNAEFLCPPENPDGVWASKEGEQQQVPPGRQAGRQAGRPPPIVLTAETSLCSKNNWKCWSRETLSSVTQGTERESLLRKWCIFSYQITFWWPKKSHFTFYPKSQKPLKGLIPQHMPDALMSVNLTQLVFDDSQPLVIHRKNIYR
jgi:hypothetical protein